MIKVNKKIEYSLLVLDILYRNPDKLFSAKEISLHYRIAFDSVSRVMQKLSKKGFLVSEQGPSGGYKLKDNLNNISILSLITVVSGPLTIARCLKGDCDQEFACNIKTPIEKLNEKLEIFYADISIAELFQLNDDK